MRSDMSKVIVERPRCRIPKRAGSWYPRGSLKMEWYPDLDLAPMREGYGHRYGEKYLNENLQPLVRFLRSRVGARWDVVRSEISKNISCNSAVQKHVLDHLKDFVVENVRVEKRVVHHFHWKGWMPLHSIGMRLRFYVCPKTRILRLAPIAKRKKKHGPKPDADVKVLGKDHELRRIDGVWYEVTLAPKGAADAGAIRTKRQLGTRALVDHGLRAAFVTAPAVS
jgi:hypothetical protein